MKLTEYGELLAHETAFWAQGLTNPDFPIGELGKLSLDVSDKFRALAIMALVTNGETDFFYHNLIRSGISREIYLLRLRQEGIRSDHHGCSGRYEPLIDALAAGDLSLARRIAELSPDEWQEIDEYEDDYCYAQILRRIIQGDPQEKELLPFFDRWAAFLDGDASARLNVCQAILTRDQKDFDDAFEALLDEQQTKVGQDKQRAQLEDPQVIAKRRIFVEGLAMLQLAKMRRLDTQLEYRYCPSLARVPMKTPFPGE